MRLLGIFIALAVVLAIPFLIWGEAFEGMWTTESLARAGTWAWAIGLLLLMGDLVLPTPSTVVMSALGLVYGPWWGGCLAATGVVLAGLLGYGICRLAGDRIAVRLVGEKDLVRGEAVFARYGTWIVAMSRWVPLLGETISCMAGLTRMPFRTYFPALICGAIPLGMTFAAVGHFGLKNPVLALLVSAVAPPVIWLIVGRKCLSD